MIVIKKRAFIFTMCFLLLFLTSCSKTSNQSSKNVSSNTPTTSSDPKKNSELKGQDVSDITKLAIPDELVYLHDGVKTTIAKENPKFKKIIQLNNARQTKKLEACKCIIDVKNPGDYLIYNYKNTNYVPVYFQLAPSPDDRLENNLFNYFGSNPIPSDQKNDKTKIGEYGHLAPADELLTYLKK